MNTTTSASSTQLEPIRKTLTVEATPQHAFDTFTHSFGTWWPIGTHHIAKVAAETAVIEPRAGGRWYERGQDGSECEWGKVLVWEPPSRIVLAWQISGEWAYDAELLTEVEVRFVPEGPNRTRVELEHRGLDAYGESMGDIRDNFNSPGGWPGILEHFATAATRA